MERDLWAPDDVDQEIVDMDLAGVGVALLDTDEGLFLVLHGGDDTAVHLQIRRNADAWLAVDRLAERIKAQVPEVRIKTLGYRPEHNAHTGPGVRGPIVRS